MVLNVKLKLLKHLIKISLNIEKETQEIFKIHDINTIAILISYDILSKI